MRRHDDTGLGPNPDGPATVRTHLNVMLVALSVTTGYTLAGLAGTVIASLVVAWALRCLIDPLVDHARNAVRGGTARRPPTRGERLAPGRAAGS